MRLTERSLENAALYYLQRFAATRAGLRRVLTMKIRRIKDAPPEKTAAMLALIDPLIERYVASGLINDRQFAEAKARSMRNKGGSKLKIVQKLAQKGVDAKTSQEVVAEVGGDEAEHAAAVELCRRKKLGAFRQGETDPDRKKKDIGVLARAGFRYAVIVRALQG